MVAGYEFARANYYDRFAGWVSIRAMRVGVALGGN